MIGLRVWLGTNDWAGLGQWVGGLGAFYAAWAALRIARDEAGRENRRENERLRVHAYFVSGSWTYSDVVHVGTNNGEQRLENKRPTMKIENVGTDPVTDVAVVATNWLAGGERLVLRAKNGPKRTLLPGQP
ncbi:hypothetical protein MUY14_07385 [Amycolatopsis sp. FBCC-B4732]|uniref:hypothetical protein n=1 Tax=Amycolatopsis sp. FBCC-B4732 TaxID=3079339 RepID=UPI001FF3AFC3|nr:hypothetical protein [Amycolatopsis sp. FBCC-B4732]UOX90438.1 hypothetical protein MUY14_07385 [Amycolatopsis sp. FBCC-B4732]